MGGNASSDQKSRGFRFSIEVHADAQRAGQWLCRGRSGPEQRTRSTVVEVGRGALLAVMTVGTLKF